MGRAPGSCCTRELQFPSVGRRQGGPAGPEGQQCAEQAEADLCVHKRRTGHRGAFTGEAGGADGLHLPKSAVRWELHLCVGAGIQLKALSLLCRAMLFVLLCRENTCTRGVLLRWPLLPVLGL